MAITNYALICIGDELRVTGLNIPQINGISDGYIEDGGIIRRIAVGDVVKVMNVGVYRRMKVVVYSMPAGHMAGFPFGRNITMDSGQMMKDVSFLVLDEVECEVAVSAAPSLANQMLKATSGTGMAAAASALVGATGLWGTSLLVTKTSTMNTPRENIWKGLTKGDRLRVLECGNIQKHPLLDYPRVWDSHLKKLRGMIVGDVLEVLTRYVSSVPTTEQVIVYKVEDKSCTVPVGKASNLSKAIEIENAQSVPFLSIEFEFLPRMESAVLEKVCTCSRMTLMREGCSCGFLKRRGS